MNTISAPLSSADAALPARRPATWHVDASQPVQFSVRIAHGLLEPANPLLAQQCGGTRHTPQRRLVVVDRNVDALYGEALRRYFDHWRIQATWQVLDIDESHKTLEHALVIVQAMERMGLLRRHETVVAIGGGVLTDLVGFACSLYRRGVPYLRVPTTLMGQIDAGIGIKTGVNQGGHKNRLGSYFAPAGVLIDPGFLASLDQRHLNNGVAEIIKMALIDDEQLFHALENTVGHMAPGAWAAPDGPLAGIMERAISGMLAHLIPNLWEQELARSVDFGHTFSPALELHAKPMLLHGEAVAVDMALSLGLATGRGYLSQDEGVRGLRLIERCGLPIQNPVFNLDLLQQALAQAVQHRDGQQRLPLPGPLGHCVFVNDLRPEELANALAWLTHYRASTERLSA